MNRVLLAGAHGQLGTALRDLLGPRIAWSGGRTDLDVTDPAAVSALVARVAPDVVINASAYNKVDAAESEPAVALLVNGAGPAHLARAARLVGALMVHVSTDYVFDGERRSPYVEDDVAHPRSVYGATKLAGEQLVRVATPEHLVVRTSGVLGLGGSRAKGGSFVERILARARSGEELRVVADQVFSPTLARDLAPALVALIDVGARGTVHVTNSGECTWAELARRALAEAGLAPRVAEITAADLGAAAARPAYSVLDGRRFESLVGRPLRHWEEALHDLVARLPA